MNSRYLNKIQAMVRDNDSLELIGDLLIVEKLPEPEARKVGGLYMQGSSHARSEMGLDTRPNMVLVVAVGKGYYDEDKNIDLNVKPGDVILVPHASVKWFSSFGDMLGYDPDTLGLTREVEIQMRFKGIEAYEEAFKKLNGQN